MIRRGTAVLAIFVLLSLSLLSVYVLRTVQDKTIEVVVISVDRRPELEPYPFYAVFKDSQGKRFILDRRDLTGSDEVWKDLREGQSLVFHHHFEGWMIFENLITWKHFDTLSAK